MVKIERLNISLIKRNAISRGPFSATQWNSTFDELTADLSRLSSQWNRLLVPLLQGLTDGTDDSLVNAWKDGLDGRTFYVNSAATSVSSTSRYYNTNRSRPNTLIEQLEDIYNSIDAVEASTSTSAGGITVAYVSTSINMTLTANHYAVRVDTSGGAIQIILPTAVGITGRVYKIKRQGGSNVTIIGTSSQTIDGNTTHTLSTDNESVTVISNNANWLIFD